MQTNILIAGVGGQGTLLTSKILGNVAIKKGYDVKVSEVHGMSQRGGSVVTYVKFSDKKVYSPIIDEGQADIIMAFELLEAYRSINYLKKGGKMLVNTQKINPMPVITGAASYPDNIIENIKEKNINLKSIDALPAAIEAGTERAVNVVLIGVLATTMDIPKEDWIDVIRNTVPEKFLEINLKAFENGFNLG